MTIAATASPHLMKLTPPPLMPPRARMHRRLGAVAVLASGLVLASGALAVALVVHLQATDHHLGEGQRAGAELLMGELGEERPSPIG